MKAGADTSLPAAAQPAGKKLPRVAIVSAGQPLAEMLGPDPIAPDCRAFVYTLRDRGWIDGQTLNALGGPRSSSRATFTSPAESRNICR
jgi:hypothetical protein